MLLLCNLHCQSSCNDVKEVYNSIVAMKSCTVQAYVSTQGVSMDIIAIGLIIVSYLAGWATQWAISERSVKITRTLNGALISVEAKSTSDCIDVYRAITKQAGDHAR